MVKDAISGNTVVGLLTNQDEMRNNPRPTDVKENFNTYATSTVWFESHKSSYLIINLIQGYFSLTCVADVSNACEATPRSLFWVPNGLRQRPHEFGQFLNRIFVIRIRVNGALNCLWRAVSKQFCFDVRIHRVRIYGGPMYITKKFAVSKISGFV